MSPRHVSLIVVLAGALTLENSSCAVAPATAEPASTSAASLPTPATVAPSAMSPAQPAPAAAPVDAAPPAVPAAAGASALHANVESVDDTRSTRERAGCRVSLSIFGDELDQVAAITDTRIDKAEDDLGRSLIAPSYGAPSEFTPPPFIRPVGPRPGLHTTVFLRNPSRNATLIKTLDLTLQLYSPSAENGAVVPIESPLPAAGTPVKNAALETQGIELVQFTPEQERDLRPQFVVSNPTPEADQRRLEAVAAEVARRRALREAQAGAAPASAGNSASPVPGANPMVAPGTPTQDNTGPALRSLPPPPRAVIFRVTDPNHRLIALQWIDSSGQLARPFMPYPSGAERLLRSYEQPRPGWRLVAYVATDGAVQSRELHLENIALP